MKTQFDVQDLRGRRQQQQVSISSKLEIFTEVWLTYKLNQILLFTTNMCCLTNESQTTNLSSTSSNLTFRCFRPLVVKEWSSLSAQQLSRSSSICDFQAYPTEVPVHPPRENEGRVDRLYCAHAYQGAQGHAR